MLVMCPECKKQFSETADLCPKCGFVLDKAIRRNLKDKAVKAVHSNVRFNRKCLLTLAIVLLVFAGPCMIGPFTSHSPYVGTESYNRMLASRMSTGDKLREEAREHKELMRLFFRLGLVMLILPAFCIFAYLYYTKKENSRED